MSPKHKKQDTAATSKRFRGIIDESIDEFLCPITQAVPLDPVLAEDGKVYDRKAIELWLKQQQRSPATNLPMGTKLVAATQVKNMIERIVKSDALADEEKVRAWKERIREEDEVAKLREEAENGDGRAAFRLGLLYKEGTKGLDVDAAKAAAFYLKAAHAGHVDGAATLAWSYLRGIGVMRNYAMALRWAAEAVGGRSASGMICLSNLYREGRAGLPVDKEEAFRLMAKGVAAGGANAKGILRLASMYEMGDGTPIDMEKAAAMMRQAIVHGSPEDAVQEARGWLAARGLAA
mmetsp:Transcript_19827/g.33014  ORF Transcript_19827/g.33014 Transcript_19827/m.33014 type:complete len:292 (+) Transcript_19827:142-1017(+)|eukprot:CAMPEP_0119323102 /NCGR_PEP_ID=MMETSP1333-20130426/60005_1 /TAXON_ID=418940 /ORGANISM="Scyphosphaera apsteinii, Strain RCC1455" /LENGTH=291 /DNA_ID=CAMNT_0007330479 /DNA_START=138 /DNA_END=1013 /DNA_ORIENTATION=-